MRNGLFAIGYLSLILIGTRALAQKTGDAAKGHETFAQCVICHDADSVETNQADPGPDEQAAGPGLKGLFRRDKLRNGKKVTEENVREIINNGGRGMPSWRDALSDDDRSNLIAYLKTL